MLCAGGNGISSAAGVFMELAAAAATPGLPCLLVWASRSAEEFETLGPMVFAMAQALQLQLTTKLCLTGMCTGKGLCTWKGSRECCIDCKTDADVCCS